MDGLAVWDRYAQVEQKSAGDDEYTRWLKTRQSHLKSETEVPVGPLKWNLV